MLLDSFWCKIGLCGIGASSANTGAELVGGDDTTARILTTAPNFDFPLITPTPSLEVSQTTEPSQCILLWRFVHLLLGGLLITIYLWHLSIDLSTLFEVSPCHRSSALPISLFSRTSLMARPVMNGLTAFPKVLGLVLLLSSCVQYTSAAAIAIASTESSRLVHPADITDSHVKPTEVVDLRSMISAASLDWPIIPTMNPDLVSWLERERSSSTASGQSAQPPRICLPRRLPQAPKP